MKAFLVLSAWFAATGALPQAFTDCGSGGELLSLKSVGVASPGPDGGPAVHPGANVTITWEGTLAKDLDSVFTTMSFYAEKEGKWSRVAWGKSLKPSGTYQPFPEMNVYFGDYSNRKAGGSDSFLFMSTIHGVNIYSTHMHWPSMSPCKSSLPSHPPFITSSY